MLMYTFATNAQENYDWNDVINAIAQVESKCNPKAYNKNGDCCGILQITQGLVKQCNTILKSKKSNKRYTLKDRFDVEKSKEMFILFQEYYNSSHDVERAIRMWNGGPGYTKKATNKYYNKVMRYYKKGGN